MSVMAEILSPDQRWLFVWLEEAGTPWAVYELDANGARTGRWLYASSEVAAYALTESGTATAQLDAYDRAAARPRCTWRGEWTASICSRPAGLDGRCDDPRHALAVAS